MRCTRSPKSVPTANISANARDDTAPRCTTWHATHLVEHLRAAAAPPPAGVEVVRGVRLPLEEEPLAEERVDLRAQRGCVDGPRGRGGFDGEREEDVGLPHVKGE